MADGCVPLSAADLLEHTPGMDGFREGVRKGLSEQLGREPTDTELSDHSSRVMSARRLERASEVFDNTLLQDAVVISADEVARYLIGLGPGWNLSDLVSVIAPPFERFFVEFENVPTNNLGFASWGVLVTQLEPQYEGERWLLQAVLVGEWRRGRPIAPIMTWIVPVNDDGHMFEGDADGHGSMFGQIPAIEGVPDEVRQEIGDGVSAQLLGSALLTISFLHCKNVDVRPVDPPERLSAKHARRHGHPLTRYYVLDIQPMRRALDRDGGLQTAGLRQALHICRGHFKTFTTDAPLFGKHTGTYWWESQVRGKTERGVVEKDYRIRLDQGLGREYIEADEHAEITTTAAEHTGLDPDLGGRGLRAHNVTQNVLAQAVRDAGYEPRRPKPDEPQFDLAWEAGDMTWVAEVKSITPLNEERQLRQALGQVLRYRQLLEEDGRAVSAMIVTEVEPTDPSWRDLCAHEGIALLWASDNLTIR